jgi:hypothetical protein
MQSRVCDPFGHLLEHILPEEFESLADIGHRGLRDGNKEGC